VRDRIEPNEAWSGAYDESYARYRALYPAVKSLEER
jgi:sugar (pentulose or hexulose) kinase